MPEASKYAAFISYSHRDKAWADWLHKTLEGYRVPRRLVGRATRYGPIPPRLIPVFRDREELPTSSSLGDNISEALRGSRHLIVVCSPNAAVSRWVNEEIKTFKAAGRQDDVLCIIVDGEPNASDRPDSGLLECFPPAVRFDVEPDGRVSDRPAEPIAADARPTGDGRDNARLKLIAGMLGVGFDELRQREARRRFWRRLQVAGATVALLLVMAGLWSWQEGGRQVDAMLAQSARLNELGRRELLEGRPLRAASYLGRAYATGSATVATRFLLAQAMPVVEALHGTFPPREQHIVEQALLSPDGSLVASSSVLGDGLRIWDVASGRVVADSPAPAPPGPNPPEAGTIAFSLHDNRPAIARIDAEDRLVVLRGADSKAAPFDGPAPGAAALAAFDVTGERLLVSSNTRDYSRPERAWQIALWDAVAAKRLAVLEEGTTYQTGGPGEDYFPGWAFTADGRTIVTRAGKRVTLWDRDGTRRRSFDIPVAGAVTPSPDGTRLAVPLDGALGILDLADGRELLRIPVAGRVGASAVVFSPDGGRFLLPVEGRRLRVFDTATGKERFTLAGTRGRNTWIGGLFSPDGNILLNRDEGAVLRLWDAWNGVLLASLDAHEDTVRSAAFSADGRRLATVSETGVTRVWELAGLLRATLVAAPVGDVDSTAGFVVTGGKDRPVEVWDGANSLSDGLLAARRLGQIAAPVASEAAMPTFGTSRDTVLVVVPAADGQPGAAAAWNLRRGGKAVEFDPGRCRYHGWPDAIDRSGKLFACELRPATSTSDEPRGIALWDLEQGTRLAEAKIELDFTESVRFSPDGKRLVLRERPDRERFASQEVVFDIESGKVVAVSEQGVLTGWQREPLTFAETGAAFALAGKAPALHPDGGATAVPVPGDPDGTQVMAFSGDGALLATAGYVGTVWLFDGRTGALRRTVEDRPGIRGLALSGSGGKLLVMAEGQFARLYDTATGQPIAQLEEEFSGRTFARFGMRDTILATWSVYDEDPPQVRFWDAATGKLLRRIVWRPGGWGKIVWNDAVGRLALTEKEVVSLRRVGLETRDWREVQALLRCRAPWRVDGERLLAVKGERQGC